VPDDSEHWSRRLPSDSRAEAYARLKNVLSEMKRMKILDEKEDYIRAEAKSLI